MRIIVFSIIMILGSCTPKKIVDSFRPDELQGKTKCERLYTRAIKRCPDLVDTITVEKDITIPIVADTIIIKQKVDSIIEVFIDTCLSITKYSSEEREKIRKSFNKIKLDKTISEYPCNIKLPIDSILLKDNSIIVKGWIYNNNLKLSYRYKKGEFTKSTPCPSNGRNWIEYILVLIIGILIGFLSKRAIF